MNPLYTVSIACHNLLPRTKSCIESVLASDERDRLEILVTDNASTDQTLEYLHELNRKGLPVEAIRQDKNVGFGPAHNQAIFNARGAYFVVLNNDTEVPKNWLGKMRRCFLDDPQVGIVGVNGTCKHLNALGVGGDGMGAPDYVEASCLMIPTWLARREALFDPQFRFAYCEDADLSLRLRTKGFKIAHASVTVRHAVGATSTAVKREGVDLDGFHAINHFRLESRWGGYLRTRRLGRELVIRRRGAVGDLLMLTPVLRALRRQNPHLSLKVATDCPEVLRGSQAEAVPHGSRSDAELDLCYEREPSLHPTAAFAKSLGASVQDFRPWITPNRQEREWARKVMPPGDWCVIHPHIGQGSSSWPGRNWPVENLNLVAHRLLDGQRGCCPGYSTRSGWRVAVVGSQGSPTVAGAELDLRGRTTLHQLAAVIERASLFVGMDSAPMHIARACQTPVVAIFGAIDPRLRLTPGLPYERGVTADIMRVGCLGCHHVHAPPRTTGLCIRDREYCMERIPVDAVMEAIRNVLEAKLMYLETSKVRDRVLPYLKGKGIDIGCARDPITTDCVAFDDDDWPEVTHRGDARKLPFKDGEFDWLWSSHCLEDIGDTEAALEEWLRVLRPGGIIGLYLPHPDLYHGCNEEHVHAGFTAVEISELLARLGCEILESSVDDRTGCYSTLVIARKT